MQANPFSASTSRVLVLVIGVSLVIGLAGMVFGVGPEERSAGNDGQSTSALGHAAFLDLLRRAGIPLVVSRLPNDLAPGSVRLLVEPELGARGGREHVSDLWWEAERALLVLPKWSGEPDPDHPGWVRSVKARPAREAEELLELLDIDGAVERPEFERLSWNEPFGFLPTLVRPQLVLSEDLEGVIECEAGILLGRSTTAEGDTHWVLSDPDLLATHGLGRGENARLALAIVRALGEPGAPVVVDESTHGGAPPDSLAKELLRFPLVLVSLQALLATATLLWAAVRRFGPPLPTRPALGRGQATLLENTAQLSLLGGHHAHTLGRYAGQVLLEVAEARHLPSGLDADERLERLAGMSRRRNLRDDPRRLKAEAQRMGASERVPNPNLLRLARRIHHWREAMLHGSRERS